MNNSDKRQRSYLVSEAMRLTKEGLSFSAISKKLEMSTVLDIRSIDKRRVR